MLLLRYRDYFNLIGHSAGYGFGCLVLALLLVGCGGNTSSPPVTLSSIAINPDPIFVGAGTTLKLSATGRYSNGATTDLTSQVVWTTADHLIATVDSSGLVTAVSTSGTTTTITAALGSVVSSVVTITVTSGSSTVSTNLATARFDHTATQLPDGSVLVTGGYDAAGNALTSSELYGQNTKLWTPTGNLNQKRGDNTAVLLLPSGQVLAVGGVNGTGGNFSSDPTQTELYDPGTGLWTLTGSLLTGRSYHSITLLADGRVLVAGGENPAAGILNSAEIFNPPTATSTGSWKATTGSLVTERYSHTATLLTTGPNKDKVLVVGGFRLLPGTVPPVGVALNSGELYDPNLDTWRPTGNLTKERFAHTATLLGDGSVLVAGGRDASGNDIASAEIYDPSNGTWTQTGSLSEARYNHLAMLMPDGKVLVMGGSNLGNIHLSSAELYDPTKRTWSGAANLQTGRDVFTATLLTTGPNAGSVLVTGGDGAAGTLSSVELYK